MSVSVLYESVQKFLFHPLPVRISLYAVTALQLDLYLTELPICMCDGILRHSDDSEASFVLADAFRSRNEPVQLGLRRAQLPANRTRDDHL